jgi:hypothetical protein
MRNETTTMKVRIEELRNGVQLAFFFLPFNSFRVSLYSMFTLFNVSCFLPGVCLSAHSTKMDEKKRENTRRSERKGNFFPFHSPFYLRFFTIETFSSFYPALIPFSTIFFFCVAVARYLFQPLLKTQTHSNSQFSDF